MLNNQEIGIIGGGAMGLLTSWFLSNAEINCSIYDHNSGHVKETKKGITVIHKDEEESFTPRISSNPAILSTSHIIILFVKSYHTAEAMEDVVPFLHGDTLLLTLQNGLGNDEVIANYLPKEKIYTGTTAMGAALDGRTLRFAGMGATRIGGSDINVADNITKLLRKAGMDAESVQDPAYYQWEKVLINAAINPLAALLRIENGIIPERAGTLQDAVIKEAVAVTHSMGYDFTIRTMTKRVRDVCAATATNRASMLQDILNGRPTEIDAINGSIVKRAESAGLDAPVNRTLTQLVSALHPQ